MRKVASQEFQEYSEIDLFNKLGFMAPVNFVFLVIIGFLLIQTFIDNIKISTLNEKIKDLNHYIALKEYDKNKEEK